MGTRGTRLEGTSGMTLVVYILGIYALEVQSGSTLWRSRESRATNFGSGESDSGHFGCLVRVYTLGV